MSTFIESYSCSVISWGFSFLYIWQLCLLTVPHTWNIAPAKKKERKKRKEKKRKCQCRYSVQWGGTFLKQTAFLNHDLLDHLKLVGLQFQSFMLNFVNLLHEQTCGGLSEVLCMFIWQCPGIPYSMAAHVVARHFLSNMLASLHHRSICKSVLFGLGTPDQICVKCVCRCLAVSHGKHLFIKNKMEWNSAVLIQPTGWPWPSGQIPYWMN
jgi:hypothetical protein